MRVSHRFTAESAAFDGHILVSLAGLVPVMASAGQTELSTLLA
ncbi:hypothetical protein GCM10022222_00900 [Amycolatopsis ultiminotia]|uniref:Uncharacterized protein n=1 Tax=Amycolatopsis ultiminotia TaxID=543629 RepID=A0ABP6UUJ6_9PSEU